MSLEIFETNIKTQEEANYLLQLLQHSISDGLISFDLKDSNHILCIETNREISGVVLSVFRKQGFYCQKLKD